MALLIPHPSLASRLRVLYTFSPIVSAAEQALRAQDVSTAPDAARLLDGWEYSPELSTTERLAVVARFVTEGPIPLPLGPGLSGPGGPVGT